MSGIATLQICGFFSAIPWTLCEVPAHVFRMSALCAQESADYQYGSSAEKYKLLVTCIILYMHLHMHTHTYVRTYVHIHAKNTSTYIRTCTYICTHACTYLYTHEHTCTHMWTHEHTCTHMNTYLYPVHETQMAETPFNAAKWVIKLGGTFPSCDTV